MNKRFEQLRDIDYRYLWHPFTQHKQWFAQDKPLIVQSAEGFELIDVNGERYLDGVSSLWCNVHGHSVPQLVTVIQQQAEELCHSTLLGLTHVPVLELAEKLLQAAPSHYSRVFFSDSGAAAVEAGLRMAIEWWARQKTESGKKKTKFLSLSSSYHGDTLGAINVGYMNAFHRYLSPYIQSAIRIPPPQIFRERDGLSDADALEVAVREARLVFEEQGSSLACLVIEPIVQGAAGIWVHPKEYLTELGALCRKYDVLLMVDEVATGFGKTGKMFASEHADITPDILTMGKGLSAGYLPISAVLTTEQIFEGFLGEPEEMNALYFGQTFAGNPLAARVSAENLDLFASSRVLETLPARTQHFHAELESRIAPLNAVYEVRKQGVMVGIELTDIPGRFSPYPPNDAAGWRVALRARELGLAIRPLGNVVILMPAIGMPEKDLSRLVEVTAESIHSVLGS